MFGATIRSHWLQLVDSVKRLHECTTIHAPPFMQFSLLVVQPTTIKKTFYPLLLVLVHAIDCFQYGGNVDIWLSDRSGIFVSISTRGATQGFVSIGRNCGKLRCLDWMILPVKIFYLFFFIKTMMNGKVLWDKLLINKLFAAIPCYFNKRGIKKKNQLNSTGGVWDVRLSYPCLGFVFSQLLS